MLKEKWRHASVFGSMLLYFTIVVTLVVVLVSSLLFYFFSRATSQEISRMSSAMLSQTAYSASVIRDQTTYIASQLINDNNIVTILFGKERDPVREYHVVRLLADVQSVYPFIDEIGLYNTASRTYFSRDGSTTVVPDPLIIRKIESYSGGRNMEFFPHKRMDEAGVAHQTVTFILHLNYSLQAANKGAIVINIDSSYLQEMILSMRKNDNSNIFITDSLGIVLSHTDPSMFNRDLSDETYMRNILHGHSAEGYATERIKGQKMLVTYEKSTNLDWYFISMQPYTDILASTYKLRQTTLLVALCIFLAAMALSLLLVRRMYNPIRMLLNKVRPSRKSGVTGNEFELLSEAFASIVDRADTIETFNHASYPMIRSHYFRGLLKGTLNDMSLQDRVMQKLESELEGPHFRVAVIRIDRFAQFFSKQTLKMQALYRFSITNIASEILAPFYKTDAVLMEEDEIALVLQSSDAIEDGVLKQAVASMQITVAGYFKLSVTVGIGMGVMSKNELPDSYKQASDFTSYRLFLGYGRTIDQEAVQERLEDAVRYPLATEKRVLENVQLQNRAGMEEEIDAFIACIGQSSYYQAITFCTQLLLSVLKNVEPMLDLMNIDSQEQYEAVNQLSELETLDEMSRALKRFCSQLCDQIEMKHSNRYAEVIKRAQSIINREYANPDLSLDGVADIIQLTPRYFGKLFKSRTSCSFGDYLRNVRLQNAVEWLILTDEPIAAISEKVGILHSTYFFTLFKKTYGLSPAQYRSLHGRT